MPASDVTPDEIKSAAPEVLGLPLGDVEAAKVAHGVTRNLRMGDVVRRYIRPEVEPANTFAARPVEG